MLALALTLSFLCGSIPFGVLIGHSRGVDVRAVGSGNIGATNVWRALGPVAGTTVFALDVAKGVAGPLLCYYLGASDAFGVEGLGKAACGIVAVLGHTFSPFLGFKGGKGIATSLGALLGLMPLAGVGIIVVWGAVLACTRMISAASIACCPGLLLLTWWLYPQWLYFAVAILMAVVVFVKHIPNIKRIRAGVEPRVGQKKAA